MPRQARKQSASGIYHIMMRGINRQTILEDEEDYERFIETINRYKKTCGYEVYAYCLMGNHVHLLLKVGHEPFAQVNPLSLGKFWKTNLTGRYPDLEASMWTRNPFGLYGKPQIRT